MKLCLVMPYPGRILKISGRGLPMTQNVIPRGTLIEEIRYLEKFEYLIMIKFEQNECNSVILATVNLTLTDFTLTVKRPYYIKMDLGYALRSHKLKYL